MEGNFLSASTNKIDGGNCAVAFCCYVSGAPVELEFCSSTFFFFVSPSLSFKVRVRRVLSRNLSTPKGMIYLYPGIN